MEKMVSLVGKLYHHSMHFAFAVDFMVVFKSITDELITDILPKYELSDEALAYIKRVRRILRLVFFHCRTMQLAGHRVHCARWQVEPRPDCCARISKHQR